MLVMAADTVYIALWHCRHTVCDFIYNKVTVEHDTYTLTERNGADIIRLMTTGVMHEYTFPHKIIQRR